MTTGRAGLRDTGTGTDVAAGGHLVPLSTRPGPLTSVVVHPAGGGLGAYLGVVTSLARRGPVFGLRAHGLAPGETPDRTVDAMVRRYRPLLDALPTAPDLLLGWSLGGVLAWELAGTLARPEPPAVVLVDSVAVAPPGRRVARADLHAAVLDELSADPDPQVRARALDTADAHLAAAAEHVATQRHEGPALLVVCDGEDRGHQLDHWIASCPDLRLRSVPGRHFDAFTGPNVGRVQRHVDDFLRSIGR